jgi:septum formation protein
VRLILASGSPRRAELLRNAGIPFVVQPGEINESRGAGESPIAYARRLAADKARIVFQKKSGDFVLGADTIVTIHDEVLEKPRSADDAVRMLRLLSGQKHLVITGICLMGPQCEDVRHETTEVFFNPFTEEDIHWYVGSGEPMDKAGGYAIQGGASRWAARIVGCYFNVVGLPVPLVYRMLKERKLL